MKTSLPLMKGCDPRTLDDYREINQAPFIILDLETTGLDTSSCHIVEIAAYAQDSIGRPLGMISTYVNPYAPIPAETKAIHHITEADVASAPDIDSALGIIIKPFIQMIGEICDAGAVLVAQNSAYDCTILQRIDPEFKSFGDWLCTKRMAQKLWPNLTSYGNQQLRYQLGLFADTLGLAPHRALADCIVTAHLLQCEILEAQLPNGYLQRKPEECARTIGDLYRLSNTLRKVEYLPFKDGKYSKKREYVNRDGDTIIEPAMIDEIAAIDPGYLKWALREKAKNLDEDTLFAIEEALKNA
jgi:exodeoxyribonuclease X